MDIYQILDELKIPFQKYEHPAVYTVAEAEKYDIQIDAGMTKNLFLRNKKGDKYFLVVMEGKKRADLKELGLMLDEPKLSFASPEKMSEYLGLTPGSVSPFGLINDSGKVVKVLVDKALMTYDRLGFHPNVNTATLAINTNDFKRFLEWTGNVVNYIEM
jgi:Ala-tRNA(Pro) deacylase